jgi:hypothetical protein
MRSSNKKNFFQLVIEQCKPGKTTQEWRVEKHGRASF